LVIYGCFWLFFTQIFVVTYWTKTVYCDFCKNHRTERRREQPTAMMFIVKHLIDNVLQIIYRQTQLVWGVASSQASTGAVRSSK